jgi:disulfide bond formation protein DsbB
MTLIKNKFFFIGILIFCVLVIFFAYFVEYILKHAPCNLCLIERIPYMATIVFASLLLFFNKYEKIISISIGLFFTFGTIISFYHFGIEQGFFNESLVCSLNKIEGAISAQDLLKELKTKSVSCKDVTFRIFGLSLATFNIFVSSIVSVIMFRIGINYDKNK